MSSRLLAVAAVAAAGVLAYAVYFDYKRRNDGTFRKKLRKEKKRVDKIASSQVALDDSVSTEELVAALDRLKRDEPQVSPAERENYFMSQVATGEQLATQGPIFHLPAAVAFYRALRVYPSPVELMVIYEKTVPAPIFKLVIQMHQLDLQEKVLGYYNEFPGKNMHVKIIDGKDKKKMVVADQDYATGDVIYKELPVVTALDADLQAAGAYCSHCLRFIDSAICIKSPQDPICVAYCSKACQLDSKAQSHNLLFTTERPLPSEIPVNAATPQEMENRRKVQAEYIAHLKKSEKSGPLLVGRFVARQVAEETLNIISTAKKPDHPTYLGEDSRYGLGDHMERLAYIDVKTTPEDTTLLANVLGAAIPDLNVFINEERMALLLGKMAYNAYGVSFGGGRADKPASTARPEDQERTRTPYGTARQIGSAFYTLSSYLTHSCEPSARPSFAHGTSELHLIANRDLKKGDVLSVAFVDVGQRQGETLEDCRRRRRMEIARGWKFACDCERCVREGGEAKVI